ncbi:MAG: heavy metal-associated domain-containing protein [Pyrinomonadaceae bacterium]|nr:heavy metal-associated domain-containing protein [Pyrinomonadaceae bacterium]
MANETVTTKVTAPDIVCDGCANAIKNAFGRVEGVKTVDVDVSTKEVSVEHLDHIAREKILDVLDKAGFPSS